MQLKCMKFWKQDKLKTLIKEKALAELIWAGAFFVILLSILIKVIKNLGS